MRIATSLSKGCDVPHRLAASALWENCSRDHGLVTVTWSMRSNHKFLSVSSNSRLIMIGMLAERYAGARMEKTIKDDFCYP
jgi:hypothetical protein